MMSTPNYVKQRQLHGNRHSTLSKYGKNMCKIADDSIVNNFFVKKVILFLHCDHIRTRRISLTRKILRHS